MHCTISVVLVQGTASGCNLQQSENCAHLLSSDQRPSTPKGRMSKPCIQAVCQSRASKTTVRMFHKYLKSHKFSRLPCERVVHCCQLPIQYLVRKRIRSTVHNDIIRLFRIEMIQDFSESLPFVFVLIHEILMFC